MARKTFFWIMPTVKPLIGLTIFVSPVGVDSESIYQGPCVKSKIVRFLGNLYYKPKERSANFLINETFPLLKKNIFS